MSSDYVDEVRAIARLAKLPDGISQGAIAAGTSIEDFRKLAFGYQTRSCTPIQTSFPEARSIGMNGKDLSRFSLRRAILQVGEHKLLDGLEKECSDETARQLGQKPEGFFIPADVLLSKRAMTAETFASAGALVGTDLSPDLIEYQRNQMHVIRLGARVLGDLRGNLAIPKHTGTATAYWLPETGTVTATDQTVGQLGLVPHRVSASTHFTKQFLVQSSIGVEDFVRRDLMTTLAVEKDRVAVAGSGASGEPRGIIGSSGVGSVTLSATQTPIWSNICDAVTTVALANAETGALGFYTSPIVRGKCWQAVKFTSTATPLWVGDRLGDYPAFASKNVPSGTSLIFGNWSDLVLAGWGTPDVVVDPYSLSTQAQIRVVVNELFDVGLRNANSFVVSTN